MKQVDVRAKLAGLLADKYIGACHYNKIDKSGDRAKVVEFFSDLIGKVWTLNLVNVDKASWAGYEMEEWQIDSRLNALCQPNMVCFDPTDKFNRVDVYVPYPGVELNEEDHHSFEEKMDTLARSFRNANVKLVNVPRNIITWNEAYKQVVYDGLVVKQKPALLPIYLKDGVAEFMSKGADNDVKVEKALERLADEVIMSYLNSGSPASVEKK